MNMLYNASIRLYAGAAHIAAHFSRKPRVMLDGQAATLGEGLSAMAAGEPYDLWIHVASLGEYEQARPVIEEYRRRDASRRVLVTFFSPSGYEVASRRKPEGVDMAYLPFDTPANARRLIGAVRPRMAIFVKYEFWGNYLSELRRRDIPVYLISAIFRPGQIFFRPWGGMFRRILGCFSGIYVQDGRSADLLAGIGVENVKIAGDTRFDRVTAIRANGMRLPAIEIFKEATPEALTLVVGSSWEADEDVYVDELKKRRTVRAVVAPHEFDDARLRAMLARFGDAMLYTEFAALAEADPDGAREKARALRYLIVDCFGILSSLYRYADAAYVGGGFGTGIHNINEAAVYGIPVVFGPHFGKFLEATELIAAGAATSVASASDVAAAFDSLSDSSARATAGSAAAAYIATKVGATLRIADDIF